ncbi:ubiquitin carboxyl-terminal hydrolase isozyme L1-like [Leptodactylus fuscus]|uniref:ubiquitin carboxyl-terminal hydrolase isozyme L1-like n=1 Tax=Leptodactylus fuscus TaxID=238119 RepID=UPI003F4EED06
MESTNCVVLNTVLRRGGVPPPFSFVDILSFEEAYIQSFCHEVYAVVLLFSRTPQHEQVIKNQDDEHKELDATVYFIAPSENPCGMVGLIHAVANNEDKLSFNHDSALKDFLNKSANRSPEERAKLLLEHEALRTILYSLAAYENGRPNDGLHAHPVVLTAVNGHLYEFGTAQVLR